MHALSLFRLAAVGISVLFAAACGGIARTELTATEPSPSARAACDVLRLQAEAPAGWDRELHVGPVGPEGPAIAHWTGGEGRYVELLAGSGSYAVTPPGQPLSVLDQPATGGEIHEGYGVMFEACGTSYALNGFGLTAADLFRMAESLHISQAGEPTTGGRFDPQCVDRTVKPTRVTVTCADAGLIAEELSWTTWGEDEATAEGSLNENDCDPTCVGGSRRHYDAHFRFYAARDGRFTTVDIEYATPDGRKRRTEYL